MTHKRHPHIILGIDPGTQVTGYAFVQQMGQTFSALDCGVIRTDAKQPLSTRYYQIFSCLCQLITEFRPDVLSVEAQFMQNNPQSAMKIAMAKCSAMLAAKQAGLEVFEYSPRKVKHAITGQGGASKELLRHMLVSHLKLSCLPRPLDASDALGIALCHGLNQHVGQQV